MAKRLDIQLLRGVAVLAVVFYHAFKILLPKGFLGVDVFFVISGFLITGMILRDLESGRFTFGYFFLRRARRLLPALLTTLVATSALAMMLLTQDQLVDYSKQLLGALTFSANFVLAKQTGYFAGAAEGKVLLHIWSLALEEQFYFIAPLLLWLTPVRHRPLLLFTSMFASAVVCFLLVSGIPLLDLTSKAALKLAFFMLPARAWELLIGGVAAWIMLRRPDLHIPAGVKYSGLVIILATFIWGLSPVHPGPDAVIVTLATATILLGQGDWLRVNALTRAFTKLGDWSYSLYLVHWPLLSFAFIVYVGAPPHWLLVALAVLAIPLAWFMFRFIELPFLNGRLSSDYVIWPIIGTVTGVMGVLAVGIYISAQPSTQATPVVGLNIACDQRGGHYYDLPICRYGTQPTVLLWGDSYAMHLEPGLRAVMGGNGSFVQATKSACSPIMALAYVGGNYSVDWAKDCVAFNRGVTSALAHMSTVRYVLIASSWGQVFTQSAQTLFADGLEQPWSPLAKKHLIKTVRAVQAVGKTAIIVGPTAIADYDVGACNARLESDRLVLGVDSCNPTFKEVDRNLGSIILELREVAMETGATLLLPTEVMCPNGICRSVIRGKSIYHDRGHLTSHGSEYVVRSLGLENMLKE